MFKIFGEKAVHKAKNVITVDVFDSSSNNAFFKSIGSISSKLRSKTAFKAISKLSLVSNAISLTSIGFFAALSGLGIKKH